MDNADGESREKDLLIGQFGAYQNGSLEAGAPANAITYNAGEAYLLEYARTAVYKIGLEEVAECLIEYTKERHHRRRLALQTRRTREKLNATARQMNTYIQPGSHVQKEASFRFEAERKELTRSNEKNRPTAHRLYQSITDA